MDDFGVPSRSFMDEKTKAIREFNSLTRTHGMNPTILREILIYRNRGYNNQKIAAYTGISRGTINKYMGKMGSMEEKEFLKVIAFVGIIVGGLIILDELTR